MGVVQGACDCGVRELCVVVGLGLREVLRAALGADARLQAFDKVWAHAGVGVVVVQLFGVLIAAAIGAGVCALYVSNHLVLLIE